MSDENVIREQVLARVRQEEEEAAARGDADGAAKPEITHDFVDQCLYANELGDGMLFSALYRHRHVFVGQADVWMFWSSHHWRMDNIGDVHFAKSDVEGVAEAYLRTSDHYHKLTKEAEEQRDKEAAARLNKKRDSIKARVTKLRSKSGRANCLEFAKTNREPTAGNTGYTKRGLLLWQPSFMPTWSEFYSILSHVSTNAQAVGNALNFVNPPVTRRKCA